MAQANFSLEAFVAYAKTTGFAKQNKFEVDITLPPGLSNSSFATESILSSLYCEGTSFPVLNITTKQLKAQGPVHQRPVGMDFGGEGIGFTFVLDQDMRLKAFFDAWFFKVVNPYSSEISYKNAYLSSLVVKQLNELDNVVYSVKLIDAFPRSLNILEVNQGSVNTFHKLTVNFAFRKWIPQHDLFATGNYSLSSGTTAPNRIQKFDPYKTRQTTLTGTDPRNGRGYVEPSEPYYTPENTFPQ